MNEKNGIVIDLQYKVLMMFSPSFSESVMEKIIDLTLDNYTEARVIDCIEHPEINAVGMKFAVMIPVEDAVE